MAWSLSINWESELIRLQLAAKLDPTLAADLEPDYPNTNPTVDEGAGSQESMRLLHTAGLMLNEYEQLKGWMGLAAPGIGQGSNAWVVAGKKTTSGRPVLCNDPHLVMSMPGPWYEMHLNCPPPPGDSGRGIHVSGASFAGAPGIIIGHNEQIAWGMTNAFPDVQDVYIERPHPDNENGQSPRFEYEGEWGEATVLREEIYLRNSLRPHVEEIVITRHGPSAERNSHIGQPGLWFPQRASADGRATRLCAGSVTIQARCCARSCASTEHRIGKSLTPPWPTGARPPRFSSSPTETTSPTASPARSLMRRSGNGLVPAPGWNRDYEWNRLIPDNELPRLLNPSSGTIVTANNKITGDDYPYLLGLETMPGWRARSY